MKETTQQTVTRLWQEISAKTGFFEPEIDIHAYTFDDVTNEFGIEHAIKGEEPIGELESGEPNGKATLHYSHDILEVYSVFALTGCLAHEMGHFALGHTANPPKSFAEAHAFEDAADKWATQHGYGPNLIEGVKDIVAYEAKTPHYNQTGKDEHSPDKKRIANIQHWMAELPK